MEQTFQKMKIRGHQEKKSRRKQEVVLVFEVFKLTNLILVTHNTLDIEIHNKSLTELVKLMYQLWFTGYMKNNKTETSMIEDEAKVSFCMQIFKWAKENMKTFIGIMFLFLR